MKGLGPSKPNKYVFLYFTPYIRLISIFIRVQHKSKTIKVLEENIREYFFIILGVGEAFLNKTSNPKSITKKTDIFRG